MNRDARAAERIVILAPAAADIVHKLGAGGSVVGVTDTVAEFALAARVGTHLNPGIETIAALRPDLIIAAPRFPPELAERIGAALFVYDPGTLEDILHVIKDLAIRIGRERQGEELVLALRNMLDGLRTPPGAPGVVYEVRANPLSVARRDSLVVDVLKRAGLRPALPETSGMLSVEYLLVHQPDIYIYQIGPMNKNPLPPPDRPGWSTLGSCVWRVNEFEFSRANSRTFETVRQLNEIMNSGDICARGRDMYADH
jgi:iron complex transport system substrate-binding protein